MQLILQRHVEKLLGCGDCGSDCDEAGDRKPHHNECSAVSDKIGCGRQVSRIHNCFDKRTN